MKRFFLPFFLLCLSAPAWAQATATLRGTVRDQASGAPLAYATVGIVSSDRGALCDSLGGFVFSDLPVGRYDLYARLIGYEPVIVQGILLSAAKEAVVDIRMSERPTLLHAVTVRPKVDKSQPLNPLALGSARMFSVEEASHYAGGFDDPARLASAFAGVSGSIGNNGIVIRGNAPRLLQWRLEGVEIPNPNHFADVTTFGGGGLTAFSSQLLGNSDFFTGAFPAEYGNALSGVFDMQLRTGNPLHREHTIQVGAIGVDFASEGPLGPQGSSYLLNYRYSTMALLSPLLPENAGGVRYQDFSFKIHLPAGRAGVFSLWGIGLADRSGQRAERDSLLWAYESDRQEMDVRQAMGAAGLRHRIHLSPRVFLQSALAATVSRLDYRTEGLDNALYLQPQSFFKNTQRNYIFSSTLHAKVNAIHTHRSGFSLTALHYTGRVEIPNDGPPADRTGAAALLAFFSASSFRLPSGWTANLGLHAQVFSPFGKTAIEPRVGIRRRWGTNHSAGLSYGLHSRLEMLHYYFSPSPAGGQRTRSMDFPRAHHLVATYDWSFSPHHHLRVEPYLQSLFRLPVTAGRTQALINLPPDWSLSGPLLFVGKGLNYGLEVTWEKYRSAGYYYLFTSSLYQSRFHTGNGLWQPTRHHRGYVFNLLGGKEWLLGRSRQNLFQINARITYQGGERFTPIDYAASQAASEVVYRTDEAFSAQFPPGIVVHFTLAYTLNRKNRAHVFALKVINGGQAIEYTGHRYNHKTSQPEPEGERLMIPNLSYKFEF